MNKPKTKKITMQEFALEYIKINVLYNIPEKGNKYKRLLAYRELAKRLNIDPWTARAKEKRLRKFFYAKMQLLVQQGLRDVNDISKRMGWVKAVEMKLNILPALLRDATSRRPQSSSRADAVINALCTQALLHDSLCARDSYVFVARSMRLAVGVPDLHEFCYRTLDTKQQGCGLETQAEPHGELLLSGIYAEEMWWDLHEMWVRAQRVSMSYLALTTRAGDAPVAALTLSHAQVADVVLLHSDVNSHRLITDDLDNILSAVEALELLWQLVIRHRLEEPAPPNSHVSAQRWTRAYHEYINTVRMASLVVLQRRWHELKLRARARVLHAVIPSEEPQPSPTKLDIEVVSRYPQIVTAPMRSWRSLVREGLIITELYPDGKVNSISAAMPCTSSEPVIHPKITEADTTTPAPQLDTVGRTASEVLPDGHPSNIHLGENADHDDVIITESHASNMPCRTKREPLASDASDFKDFKLVLPTTEDVLNTINPNQVKAEVIIESDTENEPYGEYNKTQDGESKDEIDSIKLEPGLVRKIMFLSDDEIFDISDDSQDSDEDTSEGSFDAQLLKETRVELIRVEDNPAWQEHSVNETSIDVGHFITCDVNIKKEMEDVTLAVRDRIQFEDDSDCQEELDCEDEDYTPAKIPRLDENEESPTKTTPQTTELQAEDTPRNGKKIPHFVQNQLGRKKIPKYILEQETISQLSQAVLPLNGLSTILEDLAKTTRPNYVPRVACCAARQRSLDNQARKNANLPPLPPHTHEDGPCTCCCVDEESQPLKLHDELLALQTDIDNILKKSVEIKEKRRIQYKKPRPTTNKAVINIRNNKEKSTNKNTNVGTATPAVINTKTTSKQDVKAPVETEEKNTSANEKTETDNGYREWIRQKNAHQRFFQIPGINPKEIRKAKESDSNKHTALKDKAKCIKKIDLPPKETPPKSHNDHDKSALLIRNTVKKFFQMANMNREKHDDTAATSASNTQNDHFDILPVTEKTRFTDEKNPVQIRANDSQASKKLPNGTNCLPVIDTSKEKKEMPSLKNNNPWPMGLHTPRLDKNVNVNPHTKMQMPQKHIKPSEKPQPLRPPIKAPYYANKTANPLNTGKCVSTQSNCAPVIMTAEHSTTQVGNRITAPFLEPEDTDIRKFGPNWNTRSGPPLIVAPMFTQHQSIPIAAEEPNYSGPSVLQERFIAQMTYNREYIPQMVPPPANYEGVSSITPSIRPFPPMVPPPVFGQLSTVAGMTSVPQMVPPPGVFIGPLPFNTSNVMQVPQMVPPPARFNGPIPTNSYGANPQASKPPTDSDTRQPSTSNNRNSDRVPTTSNSPQTAVTNRNNPTPGTSRSSQSETTRGRNNYSNHSSNQHRRQQTGPRSNNPIQPKLTKPKTTLIKRSRKPNTSPTATPSTSRQEPSTSQSTPTRTGPPVPPNKSIQIISSITLNRNTTAGNNRRQYPPHQSQGKKLSTCATGVVEIDKLALNKIITPKVITPQKKTCNVANNLPSGSSANKNSGSNKQHGEWLRQRNDHRRFFDVPGSSSQQVVNNRACNKECKDTRKEKPPTNTQNNKPNIEAVQEIIISDDTDSDVEIVSPPTQTTAPAQTRPPNVIQHNAQSNTPAPNATSVHDTPIRNETILEGPLTINDSSDTRITEDGPASGEHVIILPQAGSRFKPNCWIVASWPKEKGQGEAILQEEQPENTQSDINTLQGPRDMQVAEEADIPVQDDRNSSENANNSAEIQLGRNPEETSVHNRQLCSDIFAKSEAACSKMRLQNQPSLSEIPCNRDMSTHSQEDLDNNRTSELSKASSMSSVNSSGLNTSVPTVEENNSKLSNDNQEQSSTGGNIQASNIEINKPLLTPVTNNNYITANNNTYDSKTNQLLTSVTATNTLHITAQSNTVDVLADYSGDEDSSSGDALHIDIPASKIVADRFVTPDSITPETTERYKYHSPRKKDIPTLIVGEYPKERSNEESHVRQYTISQQSLHVQIPREKAVIGKTKSRKNDANEMRYRKGQNFSSMLSPEILHKTHIDVQIVGEYPSRPLSIRRTVPLHHILMQNEETAESEIETDESNTSIDQNIESPVHSDPSSSSSEPAEFNTIPHIEVWGAYPKTQKKDERSAQHEETNLPADLDAENAECVPVEDNEKGENFDSAEKSDETGHIDSGCPSGDVILIDKEKDLNVSSGEVSSKEAEVGSPVKDAKRKDNHKDLNGNEIPHTSIPNKIPNDPDSHQAEELGSQISDQPELETDSTMENVNCSNDPQLPTPDKDKEPSKHTDVPTLPVRLVKRRIRDGIRKCPMFMVPSSAPGKNNIINAPLIEYCSNENSKLEDPLEQLDLQPLDPVRLIIPPSDLDADRLKQCDFSSETKSNKPKRISRKNSKALISPNQSEQSPVVKVFQEVPVIPDAIVSKALNRKPKPTPVPITYTRTVTHKYKEQKRHAVSSLPPAVLVDTESKLVKEKLTKEWYKNFGSKPRGRPRLKSNTLNEMNRRFSLGSPPYSTKPDTNNASTSRQDTTCQTRKRKPRAVSWSERSDTSNEKDNSIKTKAHKEAASSIIMQIQRIPRYKKVIPAAIKRLTAANRKRNRAMSLCQTPNKSCKIDATEKSYSRRRFVSECSEELGVVRKEAKAVSTKRQSNASLTEHKKPLKKRRNRRSTAPADLQETEENNTNNTTDSRSENTLTNINIPEDTKKRLKYSRDNSTKSLAYVLPKLCVKHLPMRKRAFLFEEIEAANIRSELFDPTSELSADTRPEICADARPETSAGITPKLFADVTPMRRGAYLSEEIEDANIRSESSDATSESSIESRPKLTSDATPELSADARPEICADARPEISGDTTRKHSAGMRPKLSADLMPMRRRAYQFEELKEANIGSESSDATSESSTESRPKLISGATPELSADDRPETCADARPEISGDTTPKHSAGMRPKISADLIPIRRRAYQFEEIEDANIRSESSDAISESSTESRPKLTSDATPQLLTDPRPEISGGTTPKHATGIRPKLFADVIPKRRRAYLFEELEEANIGSESSDATSESSTESRPQLTSDATPELSADDRPKICADAKPEISGDTTPKHSAGMRPKLSADLIPMRRRAYQFEELEEANIRSESSDAISESSTESRPKLTSDATPQVLTDPRPEISGGTTPKHSTGIRPKLLADVIPKRRRAHLFEELEEANIGSESSDATSESSTESRPKLTSDATPELSADDRPKICADAKPEISGDTTPKHSAGMRPKLSADLIPMRRRAYQFEELEEANIRSESSDAISESSTESRPKLTSDATPQVLTDPRPEISGGTTPKHSTGIRPKLFADVIPKRRRAYLFEELEEANIGSESSDATSESSTESRPKLTSGASPELSADDRPKTCADARPEISGDTTRKHSAGMRPKLSADLIPKRRRAYLFEELEEANIRSESSDATSESSTEYRPKLISDATPQVLTDPRPKISGDTVPKHSTSIRPKLPAGVIPKRRRAYLFEELEEANIRSESSDATSESSTESRPKLTSDATPELSADDRPEICADTRPEISGDTTPKHSARMRPKLSANLIPIRRRAYQFEEIEDANIRSESSDATSESSTESRSKLTSDATPELSADDRPETCADARPEISGDTTRKHSAGMRPKICADLMPMRRRAYLFEELEEGNIRSKTSVNKTKFATHSRSELSIKAKSRISRKPKSKSANARSEFGADARRELSTENRSKHSANAKPKLSTKSLPLRRRAYLFEELEEANIVFKTSDGRPELSSDTRPKLSSDARSEISTDVRPELLSPDLSSDAKSDISADDRPKSATEPRLELSTDDMSEKSFKDMSELSNDARPESSADIRPEYCDDALSDISSDALSELSVDASPKLSVDANPELFADKKLNFCADGLSEISSDAFSELSTDARPAIAADANSESSTDRQRSLSPATIEFTESMKEVMAHKEKSEETISLPPPPAPPMPPPPPPPPPSPAPTNGPLKLRVSIPISAIRTTFLKDTSLKPVHNIKIPSNEYDQLKQRVIEDKLKNPVPIVPVSPIPDILMRRNSIVISANVGHSSNEPQVLTTSKAVETVQATEKKLDENNTPKESNVGTSKGNEIVIPPSGSNSIAAENTVTTNNIYKTTYKKKIIKVPPFNRKVLHYIKRKDQKEGESSSSGTGNMKSAAELLTGQRQLPNLSDIIKAIQSIPSPEGSSAWYNEIRMMVESPKLPIINIRVRQKPNNQKPEEPIPAIDENAAITEEQRRSIDDIPLPEVEIAPVEVALNDIPLPMDQPPVETILGAVMPPQDSDTLVSKIPKVDIVCDIDVVPEDPEQPGPSSSPKHNENSTK